MIFDMQRRINPILFFAIVAVAPAVAQPASDTTPPKLVAFSFTPTSVDVTGNPQTVTITLRVTDDLSGFNYTYSDGAFISPSGQYIYFFFSRISGTSLDGVYQSTVTIPKSHWLIRLWVVRGSDLA